MQSAVDPQEVAPEPEELLLACARFTRTASRMNRSADPSAVWRAMATLDEAGPLRVSEFAELDHCSQPTATAMIKRLEGDGLVARIADPHDGRAWLVHLTDAGRERLLRMRAHTAGLIRDRLRDQPPVAAAEELRAAITVINKMTKCLAAGSSAAGNSVEYATVHEEDIKE